MWDDDELNLASGPLVGEYVSEIRSCLIAGAPIEALPHVEQLMGFCNGLPKRVLELFEREGTSLDGESKTHLVKLLETLQPPARAVDAKPLSFRGAQPSI